MATDRDAFLTVPLAAAFLLWPALWNGYPIVFADTGTYLTQAIHRYAGWDRPVFYSLFMLPLHATVTLWPVVIAQALLTAALLRLVCRVLLPRLPAPVFVAGVALLAAATWLPWLVSELMPDLFTPLLILSITLLAWTPQHLSRRARRMVAGLATCLIATQQSSVPLTVGLLACLALCRPGARRSIHPPPHLRPEPDCPASKQDFITKTTEKHGGSRREDDRATVSLHPVCHVKPHPGFPRANPDTMRRQGDRTVLRDPPWFSASSVIKRLLARRTTRTGVAEAQTVRTGVPEALSARTGEAQSGRTPPALNPFTANPPGPNPRGLTPPAPNPFGLNPAAPPPPGHHRTRPGDRWRLLILPPTVAILALCTVNLAAHGRFAPSPYGNIFLLARVIYDGPGMAALGQNCPTEHWRLCPYRDAFPPTSDDFLWSPDSPLYRAGGPKQISADADAIIRAAIAADPLGQARAALSNTIVQLTSFASGDGLTPWPTQVTPAIAHDFPPREAAAYAAARQQGGTLAVPPPLARLHTATAVGGLIACLVLLPIALARRLSCAGLLLAVLLALPLSAAITGALSGPHDRYQARIMWLPPLAALICLANLQTPRPASAQQQPPGRSHRRDQSVL
jgi:hypothetical protein